MWGFHIDNEGRGKTYIEVVRGTTSSGLETTRVISPIRRDSKVRGREW